MNTMPFVAILLVSLTLAVLACGDANEPEAIPLNEVVVIVNSGESSVSLVPVDATQLAQKIEIPSQSATPVSLAVRGNRAVVPLGLAHAAAVLNLAELSVERIVALEQGSGATGVAFESDSIAWVANPGLNTVTRINLNTADTGSVAVGVYPQGVGYARGLIWVANSNLVSFVPAGESWLTVIDPSTSTVLDSVGLSGMNTGSIELGADAMLYVVHSGNFGSGDGALSIVDPVSRTEVSFLTGLGDFPGSSAWLSSSVLMIGSFSEGILEVDPMSRTVTRGAGAGIMPDGVGVAGVAADTAGLAYGLNSTDCVNPGKLNVLQPPGYATVRTVETGVCPFAMAVAMVTP